MIHESLVKKSVPLSLDGKNLHKLVMELDEQKQESISGGSSGAKEKFIRNKPHVNVGNFGSSDSSLTIALVLLFANPFA